MDKKLAKYNIEIQQASIPFLEYLEEILGNDLNEKLLGLTSLGNLFIFSGVIRDFFLNRKDIRDIDIVVDDNLNIAEVFKDYPITKNSYGGYKVFYESLTLDIWHLEDTWTIKNMPVLFDVERYIPQTAFFNFSSICYHINNKEFYYTTHFLNFLKNKRIDGVNLINPNYSLCVINTFYYADKLRLKISNSLIKNIERWHTQRAHQYETTQLRHFGKIIYPQEEMERRIASLTQKK